MKLFPYGHATHPDWQMASDMVLAQLRARLQDPLYASNPPLGLIYITDHFARHAPAIMDHVAQHLPAVAHWSGTVGVGISSNNVEYFDEPALAIMLCDIPDSQYRVFSGVAPLGQAMAQGFQAQTALVHADGHTPELSELIADLANSTRSGFVFGGLASSRLQSVQFARGRERTSPGSGAGHGVYSGGLSGVAFGPEVQILTRVTQGCKPLGEVRKITEANEHVVYKLDGAPALYALMQDLQVPIDNPGSAVDKVRETLVGLSLPNTPTLRLTGGLDDAVMVRHIIGLDPVRHGVAVAHMVQPGMHMAFCARDAKSAKADLLRIATEIRESLEPEELSLDPAATPDPHNTSTAGKHITGAIYVSCTGRGGPHFGSPSAELQIIQRALGDVPLVGFFAAGEIAHQQVYGYTGVLTVFTTD